MLVPQISDSAPAHPARFDELARPDADVRGACDRIARTAARMSGWPLAAVTIGDAGRQRLVAIVGANPGTTVADELTGLAAIVAAAGTFEAGDLDLDPRLAGRTAVAGPRPRRYVGVAVRDPGNRIRGTVAVADAEPGPGTSDRAAALADLAGWVDAELDRVDGDREPGLEQMKDAFLATVSHELRTPLTSVKGALSLALAGVMGEMDDEVRSVLEVGLENTDRLVRLVNDIVDLERLLTGRLPLSPTDTDARALAAAALEGVRERAEAAEVAIEVDVERAELFVDVDRTVQVLGHLVGNAVKYSPPHGRVTVATATSTEGVVFVVTDQGPGVPVEDRERVFERFAHVDASDRREQPGSGLGLPLARGLAEQQGGWLEVGSSPEAGACFRLTLPLPVRSKVVL